MDRHHVDAGLHDLIAALREPVGELRRVGLDLLDQHDWPASLDGLAPTLQRFQLHSLDVELDEVDAAKPELVEHQLADGDGVLIIYGLSDELVATALAQLEAA